MGRVRVRPVTIQGRSITFPSQNFSSKNLILVHLAMEIARECEKLPEFTSPQFRLNQDCATECELPRVCFSDVFVDLVLVQDRQELEAWDASPNVLGFHAISAGAFEDQDNDFLSRAHRVVVVLDSEDLKLHMKRERMQESDPSSNRHDRMHLNSYLATITHELAHAIEFIGHANGATPGQAQDLYDASRLDFDLHDLCTGHGIIFPIDCTLSHEDRIDIMEQRVEQTGRRWLDELSLSPELLNSALKCYGSTPVIQGSGDACESSPDALA